MGIDLFTLFLYIYLPCDSWLFFTSRHPPLGHHQKGAECDPVESQPLNIMAYAQPLACGRKLSKITPLACAVTMTTSDHKTNVCGVCVQVSNVCTVMLRSVCISLLAMTAAAYEHMTTSTHGPQLKKRNLFHLWPGSCTCISTMFETRDILHIGSTTFFFGCSKVLMTTHGMNMKTAGSLIATVPSP